MEENKKKEANSALIIFIIILVAIVSSAVSILVYRQILNKNGEEHLISSIQQDMENLQTSGNSIENTNSNNQSNIIESAILEQPVMLNNKKVNVKIESSFIEYEYELEALFRQRIDITIGGKSVDSIETTTWTQSGTINYQTPEIRLLTDAEDTEKNYIMILIDSYTPSSTSAKIYFYDVEGNKLGEINDWGATTIQLKETNTTIPAHELFSNSVRIIEPLSNGARMHEYTIVDGELKNNIIEEYNADKIEQTGAAV